MAISPYFFVYSTFSPYSFIYITISSYSFPTITIYSYYISDGEDYDDYFDIPADIPAPLWSYIPAPRWFDIPITL